MNQKQIFVLCKLNENGESLLGVFDTVYLAETYIRDNCNQNVNFMYQGKFTTCCKDYVLYRTLKFSK